MNSYVFWLALAAALGALIGSILRPGLLEIVIILVAFNTLFYSMRRLARAHRLRSPV
jgi:hypothetical protein